MRCFYADLLGSREGLAGPLGKAEALAEARSWLKGLDRGEVVQRLRALGVTLEPEWVSGLEDRAFAHLFFGPRLFSSATPAPVQQIRVCNLRSKVLLDCGTREQMPGIPCVFI